MDDENKHLEGASQGGSVSHIAMSQTMSSLSREPQGPDSPTADELLDMSQGDLLEHLQRGAQQRLRRGGSTGSASAPQLSALSLSKSRDRAPSGGLYHKPFHR